MKVIRESRGRPSVRQYEIRCLFSPCVQGFSATKAQKYFKRKNTFDNRTAVPISGVFANVWLIIIIITLEYYTLDEQIRLL